MARIVAWAEYANPNDRDVVKDFFQSFVDDDDEGAAAKYADVLELENLHSASICEVLSSTDYDPSTSVRILSEITALAKRMNNAQHAGTKIPAEDWSELYQLTNKADAILASARIEASEMERQGSATAPTPV